MKKSVGISYKAFAVILAAVLVFGGTIGGTVAWLIDADDAVTNTFTDSDINITLSETTGDITENEHKYKMIPGHTINKDPKVTVTAGSEDCYLFVKIDKSDNYDTYLAPYAIATGWSEVKDEDGNIVDGVYYRTVNSAEEAQEFFVLDKGSYDNGTDGSFSWTENQVLVKPEVTKAQMNDIKKGTVKAPTLTFTAYAVQLYKTNVGESEEAKKFAVAEAWAKAQENEQNATNN